MSDPKQIEQDLRDYLETEKNLTQTDKLKYLQTIFHKHLELTKLEHVVNYNEVFNIFSDASTYMSRTRFPVRITRKELDLKETAHLAIMESFIMYLSRMKLLKKVVKFDYKD